jgi:hypothetical protein
MNFNFQHLPYLNNEVILAKDLRSEKGARAMERPPSATTEKEKKNSLTPPNLSERNYPTMEELMYTTPLNGPNLRGNPSDPESFLKT